MEIKRSTYLILLITMICLSCEQKQKNQNSIVPETMMIRIAEIEIDPA
jgi:hypothetical protein